MDCHWHIVVQNDRSVRVRYNPRCCIDIADVPVGSSNLLGRRWENREEHRIGGQIDCPLLLVEIGENDSESDALTT